MSRIKVRDLLLTRDEAIKHRMVYRGREHWLDAVRAYKFTAEYMWAVRQRMKKADDAICAREAALIKHVKTLADVVVLPNTYSVRGTYAFKRSDSSISLENMDGISSWKDRPELITPLAAEVSHVFNRAGKISCVLSAVENILTRIIHDSMRHDEYAPYRGDPAPSMILSKMYDGETAVFMRSTGRNMTLPIAFCGALSEMEDITPSTRTRDDHLMWFKNLETISSLTEARNEQADDDR